MSESSLCCGCEELVKLIIKVFEPNSFFGKLRALYSGQVLQTQLEQLRKQGSYDAFKLEWKEVYNVRRLHKGNSRVSLPSPRVGELD